MSLDGHQTCPHCRALVTSSICTICGKSSFEPVAAPEVRERERWWAKLEDNELRKVGGFVASVVVIAAIVAFVLTRPDADTVANELPPPASTTSTTPPPVTDDDAPSVRGGTRPDIVITPGAPREVGEGLAPWDRPPAMDFVRGGLLDITADFTVDRARVAELIDRFPTQLQLQPVSTLTTFDGELDAQLIEETQPFAARALQRPEGDRVGELWVVATGGSADGDAYLAAAEARWNLDAALDQFAPEVGVRLWRLGSDETINLWASNLIDDAIVLVQAPVATPPQLLTDALTAWQRADRAAG